MKLNPQQAPLYGKCLITVQLCDEEQVEDGEGVAFFLLFAGSSQSHVTSALRKSHGTLQALCPAHACCEAVRVTLCRARPASRTEPEDASSPGAPPACPAQVVQVAEQWFTFVQDLAFDMAQFLVSTAGRADGLEGALLLDECQIPLQECEKLDESLALALHHLTLPPGWSLLGNKLANNTEPVPQETLLHFSARRGLRRVAQFLLLQSGAREALRLANKQGHTPADIAEVRGHVELHQLLSQAEVDTEQDRRTENLRADPTGTRVVCHLPRLNTHTLTVGTIPGSDSLPLQRAVDLLRHLTCHVHAEGVQSLDLKPESLHTAQECRDGVERRGTCLEPLQFHSLCPDAKSQGRVKGNKAEGTTSSDDGDVGGDAGNEGRGRATPCSPSTSELPPDHGPGPTEDRVCLGQSADGDYFETEARRGEQGEQQQQKEEEKEEEGREESALADRDLSACDKSDGAPSQAEGKSLAPGAPPLSCGKDTEETDREAIICEAQGAGEGTDRANQEGEQSTSGREEEEEKNSDSKYPERLCGERTISDMGQTQSLAESEVSDSSDSDMKYDRDEGDVGDELAESKQDLCGDLFVNEEEPGTEGLKDPISNSASLASASPIDSGDVMEEATSNSVGPCAVIEGLREGEPPPDINSLEQNQETAVRDYSTEEQCDCADASSHLAPETGRHSGDFTEVGHVKENTGRASETNEDILLSADVGEKAAIHVGDTQSTSLPLNQPQNLEETSFSTARDSDMMTMDNAVIDLIHCEASCEGMSISGNGHSELDSETVHSLSSDEEGSFQSVSSSTTEIFHFTEDTDGPNVDDKGMIMTKLVELVGSTNNIKISGRNDVEPNENDEPLSLEDSGLCPEKRSNALTASDCGKASLIFSGVEPQSQPLASLSETDTFEKAEDITHEPSRDVLSLEPALSQMCDVAEDCRESTVDTGDRICLQKAEGGSESEVPERVLDAQVSDASVAELKEELPPVELMSCKAACEEDSGEMDPELVLQQLSEGSSGTVAKEESREASAGEETSGHSEVQPAAVEDILLSVSSLEDVALASATASDAVGASPEGRVSLSHEDVASGEPPTEDMLSQREERETLKILDVADEVSEGSSTEPSSDIDNAVQDTNLSASEDTIDGVDVPARLDTSLIHRDKEAAYPLPLSPSCPTEDSRQSRLHTVSSRSSSVCPSVSSSGPSTAYRDSGSDTESFFSTDTGEDCVFRKGDEPVAGCDSTSEVSVSCSSTDDTASVGPVSSSPESCLEGQGLGRSWSLEEGTRPGAAAASRGAGSRGGGSGGGGVGETEEEAKDRLTEVPRRSAILRPSIRSLSPFRRHSWGPGKNSRGEAEMNQRSYSLEGLSGEREEAKDTAPQGANVQEPQQEARREIDVRGSLGSLTEERASALDERLGAEEQKSRRYRPLRHSCPPMTLPLTKSVSMLAISQRDIDGMRSFSSASGSLAYSISEEEPGPLRSDTEGKSGTKVSRTFSYLKSKMYKKTREKEREKKGDKDKEAKEKDKRTLNGHLFNAVSSAHVGQCYQCNKAINTKDAFHCTYCNAYVHKGCRESLPVCAKVKMKFPKQQQQQQLTVPDSNSVPAVTLRNKSAGTRERPWSAILSPDDHSSMVLPSSRRHTSIMPFHGSNLSKSISISNIAGPVFDDMPIKGLRYLSQSTDSLNRANQVNESTESLTDEGTEMMDSQLMGEFEADVKELEADSWSFTVDKKYLKQLRKDVVKRQGVIYELIQTEMHHLRTLRIMSEVYSKGLQKEVQLEAQTVDRMFPVLDELLDLHTQHFVRLLERKKESQQDASDGGFTISRIGDILVNQFSGSNAECMKRVYGKFCSRHNEAVNFYKEFFTKDKRFQAFIKKKMSSSIVRRLGIPECILLVTQRITKYPVLMQRILQHTKENEDDHDDLAEALKLVKEVIAAVDSKVNEHEKKRRLKDIYSRADSKSIMRMKSGQMFAREDLIRGRKLIHDGPLHLKNAQGRLKDVQALLLSDVFVFLQEKDQKYVFASLDQRSTVISLQNLIVREVANEERGLFLITAGIEKPEMVEVLASTKDERNTWMQLIQDAMHSIDKDEDEGIPSETEEDKRQLENKAKEMRDLLRKKDEQIVSLLEEKMKVFREIVECGSPGGEQASACKALFRATSSQDLAKGEPIMKDALQEVESLQELVNGSLGGAMAVGQQVAGGQDASGGGGGGASGGSGGGDAVGPVCLPRRAETFGGFDSHQMNSSKNDKDECEDTAVDLRRTESDSVLKKGGNANLLFLFRRNSEQVLHSVTHLHDLLTSLQAVVVQQDSFIEDQRQALMEHRSSSSANSSASSSRQSSRPNSLIEQEKQRSLEKHRQEMASLQRQQAAHSEEKRRREKEWEHREQQLTDREVLLHIQEEEAGRRRAELEDERQELQSRKEEYQRDLERLRDAQRKLERDREMVHREMERIEQLRLAEHRMERTPSSTSEDSLLQFGGGGGAPPERDPQAGEQALLSSSPRRESLPRPEAREAKPRGKSLNPFASVNAGLKGGDGHNQIPNRLLQLTKNKEKKDKKKKKGKGGSSTDPQTLSEPPLDGEIFFC